MHTPSIAFRHLPPKEGCRKPVLGVWGPCSNCRIVRVILTTCRRHGASGNHMQVADLWWSLCHVLIPMTAMIVSGSGYHSRVGFTSHTHSQLIPPPHLSITSWFPDRFTDCSSPWYNRTGWLGVKHQLTYSLIVRWYPQLAWTSQGSLCHVLHHK